MVQKTRDSRARRRTEAPLPVGVGGLALSLESTASAQRGAPALRKPSFVTAPRHDLIVDLHEDEVSDVTLGSFYVVDNENPALPARTKPVSRRRGSAGYRCRCAGCLGCLGCVYCDD